MYKVSLIYEASYKTIKLSLKTAGGATILILVARILLRVNGVANGKDDKVANGATEAPTGFDNQTNGFEDQKAFDADRGVFEEVEDIEKDGLGPVYNGTSCVGCHQNPVTRQHESSFCAARWPS